MAISLKTIHKMILNVEERVKRNHALADIKLNAVLTAIKEGERRTMAKIDDVIAAVQEETTIVASVGVLLDKLTGMVVDLREELVAAAGDTAKVDELLTAVEANKDVLRAAVLKNTPEEGTVDEHGLTT
jgi:hypothetical protein